LETSPTIGEKMQFVKQTNHRSLIIYGQFLRLQNGASKIPIMQRKFNSSTIVNKPIAASTSGPTTDPGTCPVSQNVPLKSFKEMPGPNPLPFIWNLWRYFPLIGELLLILFVIPEFIEKFPKNRTIQPLSNGSEWPLQFEEIWKDNARRNNGKS